MTALAKEFYCSANDILEINNTKEYTLTSSFILEKILTDTTLNANAVKLWQLLFNRARFHINLETQISVRKLAELLNKSLRTIFRYLNQLIEKGYLDSSNNYRGNGGQSVNTFYVRAPMDIIQQAKKNKDRSTTNNTSNVSSIKDITPALALENQDMEIVDKNDREGHDINNIPNNNINKINTNNNTVVDFSSEQFTKLETNLQKLRDKSKDYEVKWLTAAERGEKINYNKQFQYYATSADRLELEIKERKKAYLKKNLEKDRQNELTLNARYIHDLAGDRQLPEFTYKRLLSQIESLVPTHKNRILLLNEIIYEIRFGSLVINNQTKMFNSIERSINIAVKLIREGRWSNPSQIKV